MVIKRDLVSFIRIQRYGKGAAKLGSIFRIFLNDAKSVSKHFFAMAIMIAIGVLPALYAWVNIYANGNPYVNTGNIKIAVASNDPGIEFEGKHVNMTDEVFEELHESTSIGWQFPATPEEAIAGVRSGEYYAAIIFEDNFTYNMYHFEQAMLDDKAPLTYYENAKKNAVASKITETAASTLQENINTKYLETVFSIVFKETNDIKDQVQTDGENTVDRTIADLRNFQATLDSYDAAIGSFTGNSGKVKASIKSAKKNLNSTRNTAGKDISAASEDIQNAKKAVSELDKALTARHDRIDERLDSLEESLKAIDAANPVSEADEEKVRKNSDELLRELEALKAMLPEDGKMTHTENLIVTLENMIKEAQDIDNRVGAIPENIQEMFAAIDTLRTLRTDTLEPAKDALVSSMNNTISVLGPFLSTASGMLDDVDPVLDATGKTVDSMDASLAQLQQVFRTSSDRIGDIIAQVEAADENDKVQLLIDLLGGDSDQYGKFFSSLVDVQTKEIYSVASYGAAMAPFYSVLAVWVGGVILVSILKTNVDRKKFPGLSEAQYFFGRFLLFFVMGQIQAAVIVAGDIFLLDCQPVNPWFMWFSAAVTSLVFVMLIYALTLSFGDVGKAIVVVVMVVQIAGSSGSYPIEILPVIFSKIYKFFPFPYAINAMREALCGMYKYDYFMYLGELLLFAVVALVIGLVVRKPFIGMNRFVTEKLEETEVL